MPSSPGRERVTPARRQYSFAECPSTKLAACSQYEYLSSSELIRAAVARSRAGETDPLALSVALLFGPDIFWAFKDNSWPGIPYLDADEARGLPPPSTQKQKRRNLAQLVNPWTHLNSKVAQRRVVALYIPPGWTLPRLKKAIGDYLQKEYPELLVKEPLDPEWRIQTRGRGSLIEQLRVDLTGLSAWRLQKKFDYRVDDAIKLMSGSAASASASEKRAFYRAVNRAGQKIKDLEEQLVHLANRVTL